MKVSKFYGFKILGSLVLIAALASACGSQSEHITDLGTGNGNQTGGNSTPTPTPGQNPNGLPVAPSTDFNITGATGTDPIVTFSEVTDTVLRIKVKPLPAPNITVSGYSNRVIPYGCVSLRVTVNAVPRSTKVMKVEGVTESPFSQCKDAPTSDTLDFSDVLSAQGPVSIKIEAANYDNCRLNVSQFGYYGYMYYGCSMSQVWQNHRVAGSVQIQTNSYWME